MPLERDKLGGFKFGLNGPELQQSFFPDQFTRAIPWWKSGQNIQFTDLGMRKREGFSEFADTLNAEPIRGVLQRGAAAELLVYAGDLTQLYEVNANNGSVTVQGTGFSGEENGGFTFWDGGSTTWDGGSTVWDDGLIFATLWSLINYGDFILATNNIDPPQIKKTDGNFVPLQAGVVNNAQLVTPGTGYAVDDILTATGGDGSGASVRVLEVDVSGVILRIGLESGGTGYTTPPTGVSGGSGSGADVSFNNSLTDLDLSRIDIFIVRGPHVLGFGTSFDDKEFVFADADSVDVWQTASDNLAGQQPIRELKSPIRAAVPLGQAIAVYGDDQLFLVNYLANDLVFGYRPALNGIGAVSKRAVVPVGRRNFGLSRQGFFVTDGAQFQYIDIQIRKWFRENALSSQLSKTIGFHDEKNNNVRWYFPTSSATVNTGVSYNYEKNIWTLLSDDKSAGEERVLQSFPISGDSTGKLFRENSGNNAGGSPSVAFATTKPLDMNNADVWKEISSLRLGWTGTGLQYRLGWSETENGVITWEDYRDAEEGFGDMPQRIAGRYLFLEVYSGALNVDWELVSVEMIGRLEGTR